MQKLARLVAAVAVALFALVSTCATAAGPAASYFDSSGRDDVLSGGTGHNVLWGNDGNVSVEDARTCIRLLGQEVMPQLREYGEKLGLNSPFEANAPVSLAESTGLRQMAAE